MPENVEGAMFADDVSLLSSHFNKEVAEVAIQEGIKKVAEWSQRHKITLLKFLLWSPTENKVCACACLMNYRLMHALKDKHYAHLHTQASPLHL